MVFVLFYVEIAKKLFLLIIHEQCTILYTVKVSICESVGHLHVPHQKL